MVKIGDTVKIRSAMSNHDGEVGEIVDTNMFGQYKVEFEDGFVHPYSKAELKVIKPDEVPTKPTENTDQQQESDTQYVAVGEPVPEGNWKLKDIGGNGITLERV